MGTGIRYDSEIRKNYHEWIVEGFDKYADHPATKAGLQIAGILLNYTAPTTGFTCAWQLRAQQLMTMLRDNGVTSKDILIRIAELVAFMEGRPGRLKSVKEENFAYTRLVLTLVPWNMRYRAPGAVVCDRLGREIREHTWLWASRFVRKLTADGDAVRSLIQASGKWD